MRLIIGLVLFAVVAAAIGFSGVYGLSEAKLRDVEYAAPFDHPLPEDAASLEHGRHIARTRGCFGCHGQELEGRDFGEIWDWPERAVAPNLAEYARDHDVATIEAAIRQGIGANGRAIIAMPSFNFKNLTDEDTAALIAFLKSAPVVENTLPKTKLGWRVRLDYLRGIETDMTDWVAATPGLKVDAVAEPERAHGEYLAMTMCNECHGLDVRGQWQFPPPNPDLAVVSAYSRQDFQNLLETGVAMDGRELRSMIRVAPARFRDLSPKEANDLYVYLQSLALEPVPEDVFWRPEQP